MKAFRDFIEKYMKKSDYIDDQFVVGKGYHLCKQLPIPIFPRGFDQFNIAI
jgi:hypothetical protein